MNNDVITMTLASSEFCVTQHLDRRAANNVQFYCMAFATGHGIVNSGR
jgi:hypothetical protein